MGPAPLADTYLAFEMFRFAPTWEMILVRLSAHVLAAGAIALSLVFLSRALVPISAGRAEIVAAVEVVVERQSAPRRPRSRIADEIGAATAPAFKSNAEHPLVAPTLWTYDELGRIVLNTREQLHRCLHARRLRREEADCPSSQDRRVMIARDAFLKRQ